jgi:hypothetical protein
MEAVSQVWAGRTNNTHYSGSYNWLSSDYEYLSHSAINNQGKEGASGWKFVTIPEKGIDIFGYGKYKLTVEGKYFYLDYRDDRIGYYGDFGPSTGHPIDIYIKYDHNSEELSINSYNDESHWLGISQNTTINIWELKGMGAPSTAKFEPYVPENLTISLSSGKPLLNWDHHSPAEDYWIGYKIYRCITIDNEQPTNYEEIAEVGKNTTSYIDNNLCFAN